jgi:hypothetical protein
MPKVNLACGDPVAEQHRANLQRGNWEPVADHLESLRDWDERDFYISAITRWPGFPVWIQAWTEKRPDSPTAWVVSGIQSLDWAWEARGEGTADTVSDVAAEEFEERLQQAEEQLHRAAELAPDDPAPWAHLITAAMGLGADLDDCFSHLQEAKARYPQHHEAHANMVKALSGKWGGSSRKMFKFVFDTCAELPEGHELYVLVPYAHLEQMLDYDVGGEGLNSMLHFHRKQTRREIMDAAARSIHSKAYRPTKMSPIVRATFAYVFCKMCRFAIAAPEFRLMGPNIFGPWRTHHPGAPVVNYVIVRALSRSAGWLMRT